MELTKNEKKVLKILLDNSRTTDSEIASKLKISSQAVGKLRKKLENNLVSGYTLNLDYSKLGISIFALAIARLTREGAKKGQFEVEQDLMNISQVIQIYRIPKISSTHIILYGFTDLQELDKFFYNQNMREKLHSLIETQELYTFSHNSLVKNDPNQLFHKVINELGEKKFRFEELESYKRRV